MDLNKEKFSVFLGRGNVLPAYGEKSLAELVPTVLSLFGDAEPSERFVDRIGDILILPHGHMCLWNKGFKKDPGKILGIHGGLSYEEMMIPFGIARLLDLCE